MIHFVSSGYGGPSISCGNKDAMKTRINDYLKAYEQLGYFSGSVLVAYDGEVLLNEGYGMANREHEVKNTSDTIFRLGSVSKPITATAIMLLHEKGFLDVDQTIDWYLTDIPSGNRITIHHLLTHTSGLNHSSDGSLLFEPGSKFAYVNTGYILLSRIIEMVSGYTFGQYLKETIFEPSGMQNSGYAGEEEIHKGQADGYSAYEDRVIDGKFVDMSTLAGAAGLFSTTSDLFRFDQALQTGQLLSRHTLERIFTPFRENYGYGWYIDEQVFSGITRKRISHGGLNDSGFFTRMTRFKDDQLLVITLSNFLLSPLEKMNRDLAALIFGETINDPEKADPNVGEPAPHTDYERLAGQYEAFMPIPVTVEQSRLFISIFGFKLELFLQNETETQIDCYSKAAYVHVTFHKNNSGIVTGATIQWLGEDGYYAKRSGANE
ncbi:serine hydrolase [Paenibacillus tarimensis]